MIREIILVYIHHLENSRKLKTKKMKRDSGPWFSILRVSISTGILTLLNPTDHQTLTPAGRFCPNQLTVWHVRQDRTVTNNLQQFDYEVARAAKCTAGEVGYVRFGIRLLASSSSVVGPLYPTRLLRDASSNNEIISGLIRKSLSKFQIQDQALARWKRQVLLTARRFCSETRKPDRNLMKLAEVSASNLMHHPNTCLLLQVKISVKIELGLA
jgi:hypothetical protein